MIDDYYAGVVERSYPQSCLPARFGHLPSLLRRTYTAPRINTLRADEHIPRNETKSTRDRGSLPRTMLSTLSSLLLPAPVHSNLSRLRRSASDPEYHSPEPEWPDIRPTSSSSAASSSIPATPGRRGLGYSGTSTPVGEAALVQGVRESLLETREGSFSGINWDAVRRGMFTLIHHLSTRVDPFSVHASKVEWRPEQGS